ncbi:MAG: hypothetical protein ACTHJL_03260 [Amnibacterium sp.]
MQEAAEAVVVLMAVVMAVVVVVAVAVAVAVFGTVAVVMAVLVDVRRVARAAHDRCSTGRTAPWPAW